MSHRTSFCSPSAMARTLLIGMAGLGLLVLGLVFEGTAWGTTLTVAGGMTLAIAHVGNLRATRLQYLTSL